MSKPLAIDATDWQKVAIHTTFEGIGVGLVWILMQASPWLSALPTPWNLVAVGVASIAIKVLRVWIPST